MNNNNNLLKDIIDYKKNNNLSDIDFAKAINVSPSLWNMNKLSSRPFGLKVIQGIYQNIPALRISIEKWLLGDDFEGPLPARFRLQEAWSSLLKRVYQIGQKRA